MPGLNSDTYIREFKLREVLVEEEEMAEVCRLAKKGLYMELGIAITEEKTA
jgi:hypothetical protein